MSRDDDLAVRRAAAALELRRPAEAQRLLAELLARSPDDAWAHGLMGHAMIDTGAPWGAWRQYADRAAALAPADVGLLVHLAEMSRKAGDVAAARWYVDRALTVSPDNVSALNVLSLVQYDQGDLKSALRTSSTVLDRMPDNPSLLVANGMALAKAGHLAEAQARYVAALAIDPHHVYALNNLASARLRCGDLDRAARLLQAAITQDPRERIVRVNVDAVGTTARRLALAMLMLSLGVAFGLGLISPWLGAAGGALMAAWTVRDLLLLPAPVRRRLLAKVNGWDAFWLALLLVGTVSVVAGLVSGDPSSSVLSIYAVVIGLRLVVPVVYRRASSAWGLWRRGVRLP